VLLLTCSYMDQEFIRVGYYVNNDYDDEQLREEPPTKVLIDKVQRNILTDKPRVTKFPINFHPENEQTLGDGPAPTEPFADSVVNGEAPVFLEQPQKLQEIEQFDDSDVNGEAIALLDQPQNLQET